MLVVLHRYAFDGLLNNGDTLTFFLPTYCLMGKSLAAGHILAWNPFTMGGIPFAADPQSGWMHVPVMVLFTMLSCDVAIRMLVVIQPILAGFGMLWFLRGEGLSRTAASAGGVVLSLAIAGSNLAVSVPFAGVLAWTSILLAASAKYVRAKRWSSRLIWAILVAAAWGQLAAAHFSVGLLLGTLATVAYLTGYAWHQLAGGRWRLRQALFYGALLILLLPLLNLAFLLPRLGYLPETTSAIGYAGLERVALHLSGSRVLPPIEQATTSLAWPLKLATLPGAYLGAAALVLTLAGWWDRRHRWLTASLTALAAMSYVVSLRVVAMRVPSFMRSWIFVDAYLHNPQWFGYLFLLSIVVLGALGVEAWSQHLSTSQRALMVAPGALVWFVLPLARGATRSQVELPLAALAVAAVVLAASVRRPALLVVLPVLLGVELVFAGIHTGGSVPFAPLPALLKPLPLPHIDAHQYLQPGSIVDRLQGSAQRYMAVAQESVQETDQPNAPLGILNQSMLFHVENTSGYNPVQLARFWTFVRALDQAPALYNRSLFSRSNHLAVDLLQVGWFLMPTEERTTTEAPSVSEAGWSLYAAPDPPPRAELIGSWKLSTPSEALSIVATTGFDPTAQVILEENPGLAQAPSIRGVTSWQPQGPQAAIVDVQTDSPALLLVRIPFAKHWRASIDGVTVSPLRADYVLQAVPVPAGHHLVRLSYDDPLIGYGLLGSGFVISSILLVWLYRRRREGMSTPGRTGPEAE